MSGSLIDPSGRRKYLVSSERRAFLIAAERHLTEPKVAFCYVLGLSGARISEVLALTPERIDVGNLSIVFETLKRRERGIFRAVPMPKGLITLVARLSVCPGERIWPWCRTTAWSLTKATMKEARVPEHLCTPRALRHTFGVEAGQQRIPLNLAQRWLGHARIETTAIYSDALGEEERRLAKQTWNTLDQLKYMSN